MTLLLLQGCAAIGESRFNPFNWFGQDEETLDPIAVENERRPLVAQITSLEVERTPGGAIIRVHRLAHQPGLVRTGTGQPRSLRRSRGRCSVLQLSRRAARDAETRLDCRNRANCPRASLFRTSFCNRVRVIQVTGAQNSRPPLEQSLARRRPRSAALSNLDFDGVAVGLQTQFAPTQAQGVFAKGFAPPALQDRAIVDMPAEISSSSADGGDQLLCHAQLFGPGLQKNAQQIRQVRG